MKEEKARAENFIRKQKWTDGNQEGGRRKMGQKTRQECQKRSKGDKISEGRALRYCDACECRYARRLLGRQCWEGRDPFLT